MIDGDSLSEDENLISWEIVAVDPSLIEIDLKFEKPLEVSSGDEYDTLLI